MGYLLFVIASILKWALTPLLYLYGFIQSIRRKEFQKWHKTLAISKDQHGNVLGAYIFNDLLIYRDGVQFGDADTTISACLGYNKKKQTLRPLGKLVANTLNWIDPNHVEKAIE